MDQLTKELRAVVGGENVLSEPDELIVYECDGLTQHKHPPRAVVFPASTEQVAEVVKVLAGARISFAPRGAGTGLSGGALAINRGVVIEMARMRRLLRVDAENRLAVVETGMINAQLSRAVAAYGLHYVPDPSSGATCTIGGNIAENAGGIHCLKYGVTSDHVLGARVVLPDGRIVNLGGAGAESPGYDLLGLFVGSEGTFGIATEATVKLVPVPEAVRTLLADFADVNDASRAVSSIIAAGLVPAALEMMDGATIGAIEASVFAAGLPRDAGAALLIELDGLEAGLDDEAHRAETICRGHGARGVRLARGEGERKRFWAARKGAFGAMGRLAPDMMIQDAVVPRSRLPEILAETYRVSREYRLRLANVFHAGDGNLHPFISFDRRDADELRRVEEAGREIMKACVRAGGTITGEHGVGLDKSAYLPLIFSDDDLDVMLRVRAAFDPEGLCNPGKIIPAPRGCGEARAVAANASGGAEADSPAPEESYASGRRPTSFGMGVNGPAAPPASRLKVDAVVRELAAVAGVEHVSHTSERVEVAPSSVEEACELMRFAARAGWKVTPAGARTWSDACTARKESSIIITTRRMARLVAHEPADLVATAEAGLPLARFNEETGRAGQWLPIDPPDDGRATLGGVAATGLGGAQAFGYGLVRGHVLGMRAVLADGRAVKFGGGVVKNVAGYDLSKLFVGSYGTLGLITELTFKLRPRPPRECTLVAHGDDYNALLEVGRALLAARLMPVAVELLSPGLAATLDLRGGAGSYALLLRFAGSERSVAFQTERAAGLLRAPACMVQSEAVDSDADLWRALAAAPLSHEHGLGWRASVRPADIRALLQAVASGGNESDSAALWHAGLGDGRVRLMRHLSRDEHGDLEKLREVRRVAESHGGALVVEHAPRELKDQLDAWGLRDDIAGLMRRIKRQLDPDSLFCPGRFDLSDER